MHGVLDWCVRNSYSPRHHENIGRCVLHAAHVACSPVAQGQRYEAAALPPGPPGAPGPLPLQPSLADAVTAHPLLRPEDFDVLRAYVSRVRTSSSKARGRRGGGDVQHFCMRQVQLESSAAEVRRLKAALRGAARRHPPDFRNRTWPAGLREDPGLAPVPPDNRYAALRPRPRCSNEAGRG